VTATKNEGVYMARKTTKKVAKKVTKGQRGRRLASEDSPKYDPRKHIKLSELARQCNISYQSMYLKQKRTKVKAFAANNNGVEVMVFSLADAKKIADAKARPMRKDSIPLKDLEKELQVSRPKLTNVLLKLRISPVKRQGNDNRQTLTVTSTESQKIREALKA